MATAGKLTDKQQRFIDEYLKIWDATKAAKRAGYSENFTNTNASKILQNTTVAAAIQTRLNELKMTADEALKRTADIARGDLTEWLDADGHFDIAALRAAGMGHLIKKYKTTRRVLVDGTEIVTVDVELYPADAAHDKLLRHHGQYNDKLAVDLDAQFATEIVIDRGHAD